MIQIKFNFNNFARLPQLGSVPAAYAPLVAGAVACIACVISSIRCVRCVGWKPGGWHTTQVIPQLHRGQN